MVVEIGNVCDTARVEEIFDKYRPGVVFHAAAHKHVPLMEQCPREAVQNNVFGTLNAVRAADEHGVKRFISNAGYDGPCVLFALQKDEESGKDLVTGLVIDKFCEGYSISSPWEKIGYRGSEVYDIFLDDVKVTEDQILGKPGDGFTQLLGTTAYGKLGFTAVFVGTALGAADIALKYCQEKLHRGKSITKFPTTQLRLSTMLTYAHTAELLLLEAADYCDHNHFEPDDIPTMRAVQARTAQAKGYAAETATKVATMAVNAMGAYGVCDEYQAERFLRDAAVAPNIEGSGDIQYLIHGMFVAANGNTN